VSGMPAPAGVAVTGAGIVPRASIVAAWQALRRRLRRLRVGGPATESAAAAAAG